MSFMFPIMIGNNDQISVNQIPIFNRYGKLPSSDWEYHGKKLGYYKRLQSIFDDMDFYCWIFNAII